MSKVEGIKKLSARLAAMGGNVSDTARGAVLDSCHMIEASAKALCPVDTGNLRASLHTAVTVEGGAVVGSVGTAVHYAPYVEFGTGAAGAGSPSPPKSPKISGYRHDWRGNQAQPFLYPALIGNKKNIIAAFRRRFINEINRRGG